MTMTMTKLVLHGQVMFTFLWVHWSLSIYILANCKVFYLLFIFTSYKWALSIFIQWNWPNGKVIFDKSFHLLFEEGSHAWFPMLIFLVVRLNWNRRKPTVLPHESRNCSMTHAYQSRLSWFCCSFLRYRNALRTDLPIGLCVDLSSHFWGDQLGKPLNFASECIKHPTQRTGRVQQWHHNPLYIRDQDNTTRANFGLWLKVYYPL